MNSLQDTDYVEKSLLCFILNFYIVPKQNVFREQKAVLICAMSALPS